MLGIPQFSLYTPGLNGGCEKKSIRGRSPPDLRGTQKGATLACRPVCGSGTLESVDALTPGYGLANVEDPHEQGERVESHLIMDLSERTSGCNSISTTLALRRRLVDE